jgi:hypothetical protein
MGGPGTGSARVDRSPFRWRSGDSPPRGLAASSNEPLYNHLPARLYFGNVRRNGERRFLRDFRLSSVGADRCLSVEGEHRCVRDAADDSFLPPAVCGGEP